MQNLPLPMEMSPFIKEIIFFDGKDESEEHKIPFYADGFAGIVFSQSDHPFIIQPQNKVLPDFYLYGQTITPMALETKGAFKVYAVRLFPFAVRTLLDVDPKTLNDDCYDLMLVENIDTKGSIHDLSKADSHNKVVSILMRYFKLLLKNAATVPSQRMILAVNMILKSNGNISITEIRESLHTTERTLERLFQKEMGVTAKQFAKIIQFSSSMKTLTEEEYINLTDIGYQSGYADQSHFIRSFKRYTGQTPKEFRRSLAL